MFSQYPELRELSTALTADAKWTGVSDDTFRVSTLRNGYTVSNKTLDALHPLLSSCVKELSHRNENLHSYRHVSGEDVKTTITYLTRGTIDISGGDGQTHRLVELYSFLVEPGLSVVIITGSKAYVTHSTKDDLQIPVVTTSGWATYEVPRIELDERYPGWEQRFTVGTELGIDGADLVYYALQKPTPGLDPVTIAEVTFK